MLVILFESCVTHAINNSKVPEYYCTMKINKHSIINIQVLQWKFDVINKWCHAEVNEAYPMCAFIKFIFGVTFFKLLDTKFDA